MDSMRAIAVLCVIAYHALFRVAPAGSDSAIRPFATHLGVGVSIFFVISGFLLYRPFVAARVEGKQWLSGRAFAWRRFLRIAPAYWVALTVIALWIGLNGVLTPEGIPRFYLLGQVYSEYTAVAGLSQAWSLYVEVGFYLFLAAWAFGMRAVPGRDRSARLRSEWITLAVLFVAGEAYNIVVLGQVEDGSYSVFLRTVFSYTDHFVAGMALAVASVALHGRERMPAPVRLIERVPSVAWAVAVAAFLFGSGAIGLGDAAPPTDVQTWGRRTLYAVIAVCVVMPAVFGSPGQGLTRRILGWRPLLWIGLVSYGAFLYNVAVLTQLDRWEVSPFGGIHPYLKVIDLLIPTLVLAALSYYIVERPALSLKRLVGPSSKPAPPIVPAAPGSRQSA